MELTSTEQEPIYRYAPDLNEKFHARFWANNLVKTFREENARKGRGRLYLILGMNLAVPPEHNDRYFALLLTRRQWRKNKVDIQKGRATQAALRDDVSLLSNIGLAYI